MCPRFVDRADTFEDLPGKWHAAVLKSEENRPKLQAAHAGAAEAPETRRSELEA